MSWALWFFLGCGTRWSAAPVRSWCLWPWRFCSATRSCWWGSPGPEAWSGFCAMWVNSTTLNVVVQQTEMHCFCPCSRCLCKNLTIIPFRYRRKTQTPLWLKPSTRGTNTAELQCTLYSHMEHTHICAQRCFFPGFQTYSTERLTDCVPGDSSLYDWTENSSWATFSKPWGLPEISQLSPKNRMNYTWKGHWKQLLYRVDARRMQGGINLFFLISFFL